MEADDPSSNQECEKDISQSSPRTTHKFGLRVHPKKQLHNSEYAKRFRSCFIPPFFLLPSVPYDILCLRESCSIFEKPRVKGEPKFSGHVAVKGPLMHHLLHKMSASGANKNAPNLAIRSRALKFSKTIFGDSFWKPYTYVSHIERFTRSGTVALQNSVARSLSLRITPDADSYV